MCNTLIYQGYFLIGKKNVVNEGFDCTVDALTYFVEEYRNLVPLRPHYSRVGRIFFFVVYWYYVQFSDF